MRYVMGPHAQRERVKQTLFFHGTHLLIETCLSQGQFTLPATSVHHFCVCRIDICQLSDDKIR